MVRKILLTAVVLAVPTGAMLLDLRKEPAPIKDIEFVSAVEPDARESKELAKQAEGPILATAKKQTPVRPKARPAKAAPSQANSAEKDIDYIALAKRDLANLQDSESRVQQMRALINRGLREGRPDAYVDALINEYVDALGDEAPQESVALVPLELRTPEGELDTRALLAALVEQSDMAANGGYTSQIDVASAAGNTSGLKSPKEDVIYTVKSGDSLAAIAYRHYGRTAEFTRIFEANRSKLTGANQIQVGLRLVIPAL